MSTDTDLTTILDLVQPETVLPQPPKRDIDPINDLVDELNKISNFQWNRYGVDEVWVQYRSFSFSHRINLESLLYLSIPLSVVAREILDMACVSLGKTILEKE